MDGSKKYFLNSITQSNDIVGTNIKAINDLSSTTFLGQPNVYFTGITSNLQQQIDLLTYNQLLTVSASLTTIQTASGNVNVYLSSYVQPQINTLSGLVYLHTNQISSLSGVINTISNYIIIYGNTFIQPQINTLSGIIYLHSNQINSLSGVINTISNYIVTYNNSFIQPQINTISSIVYLHTNQLSSLSGVINTISNYIVTYNNSFIQPQINTISDIVYLHTNQIRSLSGVINTISNYIVTYNNTFIQTQISAISGIVNTLSNYIPFYSSTFIQPQVNSISSIVYLHTNQISSLSGVINTISNYIVTYSNTFIQPQISAISGVVNTLSNYIPFYSTTYIQPQINSISGVVFALSGKLDYSNYNIRIGTNALDNVISFPILDSKTLQFIDGVAIYNTAIGYKAGYGDISNKVVSNFNTFLGANTYIGAGEAHQYSTAIGCGARITGSHQIQIGTEYEYVNISNTDLSAFSVAGGGRFDRVACNSLYVENLPVYYTQDQLNTLSGYAYLHTNQLSSLSGVVNTISNYIPFYSSTFIQPQVNSISSIVYLHTNQISSLSGVINTISNYILTYSNNFIQPQVNSISSIVYLHTNQLSSLSGVINTISNYIVTYSNTFIQPQINTISGINYLNTNQIKSLSGVIYTISNYIVTYGNTYVQPQINSLSGLLNILNTQLITLSSNIYSPFTIGNVETLPSGSSAYVTLSGRIINFGIVTGAKGDQGLVGRSGDAVAEAALILGVLTTVIVGGGLIASTIYNNSIFASLQSQITANTNDIGDVKGRITNFYHASRAYENSNILVAPLYIGDNRQLSYFSGGDFAIFQGIHQYLYRQPALFYNAADNSIQLYYCTFGSNTYACMSVFTNGITINNTNGFPKFVFNAELSTALINANTTINSSIFKIVDVNNVAKFSLDPVTTNFTITTIPLSIDISSNLTFNTNQLKINPANNTVATFCQSTYLSVSTTIGDPATAYVACVAAAGASVLFKIPTNPAINNSIVSSSLNGSDSFTIFCSQFAVKHPTTNNQAITILNDQSLSTNCSQYNFNAGQYDAPFRFIGGTGSNFVFTGSTLTFNNANFLPGLNATAGEYQCQVVFNGDVYVSGRLIVGAGIFPNSRNRGVNQQQYDVINQLQANNGLVGIGNAAGLRNG